VIAILPNKAMMTKFWLENLPSDKMGIHKKARCGNSHHPPDETGKINCPPDEMGIHISSLQKILQVVGNNCMWASTTKDTASCREY
jgi:hypothetical protein